MIDHNALDNTSFTFPAGLSNRLVVRAFASSIGTFTVFDLKPTQITVLEDAFAFQFENNPDGEPAWKIFFSRLHKSIIKLSTFLFFVERLRATRSMNPWQVITWSFAAVSPKTRFVKIVTVTWASS